MEIDSQDPDELLIEFVRNYPFIYDKSNPDHKDNTMINDAFIEIGSVLNMTGVQCSNRWSRLRERFSRENKKMKLPRGSSSIHEVKWPLFDNLKFLEKHIATRKRYSNAKLKTSQEDSNQCAPETLSDDADSIPTTPTSTGIGVIKKKKTDAVEASFIELSSAVKTYLGCSIGKKIGPQDDSDELFARFIVAELKNLPEEKKKEKKKLLTNLLLS